MNSLIRSLRRRATVAVSGVDTDVHATARAIATSVRSTGRSHADEGRDTALSLADAGRSITGSLAGAAFGTVLTLADVTATSARRPVSCVRAVAFWLGIALPFVHVPLLLAFGLTTRTAAPLVALWLLHAFVLAVGSRHRPRPS